MRIHPSHMLALTVLSALLAMPADTGATPEPGRYAGIVRITKSTLVEGTNTLSVTTTMKVVAQVFEVGSETRLTILGITEEPLASAFNTSSSIVQGTFQPDGTCIIHGPPFGGPGGPGEYLASVTERRNGFTLGHENLPLGMNWLIDPHRTQPITLFEYKFQRVAPPPAPAPRRGAGGRARQAL